MSHIEHYEIASVNWSRIGLCFAFHERRVGKPTEKGHMMTSRAGAKAHECSFANEEAEAQRGSTYVRGKAETGSDSELLLRLPLSLLVRSY